MKISVLPRIVTLSALALIIASPSVFATGDGSSAIGHWEGHIEVPGSQLGVVVDLLQEDGAWQGHLDIPAQSIVDFALKNIEIEGANVQFELTVVPGEPTFTGTLAEDGATLSGNFTQGGQTLPFTLSRTSADPEPVKGLDQSVHDWIGEGAPGQGLAAVWRGALTVGGTSLRLELKVTQAEAGGFAGTMDSVDQGANGLALETITIESGAVSFKVPAVNGSFEGQLDDEGAVLSGSWSQGPGALPLTLHRQGS